MKNNHRRKLRWNNIILFSVFLIFLIVFIIYGIKVIKWMIDSKNTNKEINEIIRIIEIESIEDNSNTEFTIDENNVEVVDPYWDYIKTPLINVNFNELKEINSSVVGWIQVDGTNINYPFVQTTNNSYYLTHSFNKSYNRAGWVFMDYRNNHEDFDRNTILYAHGRIDNTMFGSLRKIISNGWLDFSDSHIIKISTENENTLWQVFSVYKIRTTSDYLRISFSSEDSFLRFAERLKKRSMYDFNTNISEGDKILTLSTCYDDDNKVVLHAKLIKKETR